MLLAPRTGKCWPAIDRVRDILLTPVQRTVSNRGRSTMKDSGQQEKLDNRLSTQLQPLWISDAPFVYEHVFLESGSTVINTLMNVTMNTGNEHWQCNDYLPSRHLTRQRGCQHTTSKFQKNICFKMRAVGCKVGRHFWKWSIVETFLPVPIITSLPIGS